jgi:hypothetical protein
MEMEKKKNKKIRHTKTVCWIIQRGGYFISNFLNERQNINLPFLEGQINKLVPRLTSRINAVHISNVKSAGNSRDGS